MLGSKIPLRTLCLFCRGLSTLLDSGVMIHKAIATAGGKIGDSKFRRIVKEVADSIRRGTGFAEALEQHSPYFPRLFIDMISVAENSGTLPEVLKRLAEHYESLSRLRKDFIGQITLPVVQFCAAVLIITFLIYILGVIAQTRGGKPMDVLGWGLTGTKGAMTFLSYVLGSIGCLVVIYFLATRALGQRRAIHAMLLRIPVIGYCMRSFAIARFSWAYALTQQAGMDVIPSLEASLNATANGAFVGERERICYHIQDGLELTSALESSGLFPDDYLEMVRVGESSGTVPEMLERLSPNFEDQARRSLSALAAAVGWMVWALVATFIIVVIFSVMSWYLAQLNDAMKGI